MSTIVMTQVLVDYFNIQHVLKAWILGSFLRGEERADCDVDIFILHDMYEDLKNILGREIDLISEGGLMPFARETVNRLSILSDYLK